jgi:beta-lactamase regulating signal transducer with metallopeptidase domain
MEKMVLQLLNPFAEGMVHFFSAQTIYSTFLFVIIFPAALLLKNKSKLLILGLWSLIFIRFILPPDLSSPFSGRALMNSILPGRKAIEGFLESGKVSDVVQSAASQPESLSSPVSSTWTIEHLLFLFWVSGFSFCLISYLIRLRRYHRIIQRASTVMTQTTIRLFEKWKNEFRIRREVSLVVGDEVVSPFTLGVRKPVIFMPECLLLNSDESTLESIVSHEMAHVKQYDEVWIKLQNIIQLINFFNPLVWIAGMRLHQARECLCDALVLSKRTMTPKQYGTGLLNIVQMNVLQHEKLILLPELGNQKKRLVQRVENIKRLGFRRNRNINTSLLLILVGLFLLPMANGQGLNKRSAATLDQALRFLSPIKYAFLLKKVDKECDSKIKKECLHQGVDIKSYSRPIQTIIASTDGKVSGIYQDEIFQRRYQGLTLKHDDGYSTRYLHLDSICVKMNEIVKTGQTIGWSTSCLHFEILKNGKPQDPEDYIRFEPFFQTAKKK